MIANKRLIDQAARQRALNTQLSFAVSAPAGSGKTGLLTQRVLALLAQCDEPENVLAITFTRKAAAEMQARILEALDNAQQQPTEPEADYEKTTWHLAQAVLQRNKDKQWQLLSCPNRLRIMTIDSLCRSLSQQMPFESQLGHTSEILDNVNRAYQLAARETLQQLHRPSEIQGDLIRLVKHFNNQLDQIETLFIRLLVKRDQWLGIVFQTKNQRELLEAMLVEVIEEHLQSLQHTLLPIASELVLLADHAANNLQDSSSPIKSCLGLTGLPSADSSFIPQWLGIAELLLTQAGSLRKSATKTIGFLSPLDRSLSPEQKESAKIFKQRMAELLTEAQKISELESTLHQIRTLPSSGYSENQWELLDSLTHVLINLASNLHITFQQLGKIDYLAVTLAALDALGEPDRPTNLALALDYKIQHILVDEFQDTSTTQLELLQRLTAGWQTHDGRTLFVVGDAMQSCYRFRDANVGIFLDVRQHGISDITLEPLNLQVNFRSQQGIVNWVNQSFQRIFPAVNNSNRGAVAYSPSTSFKSALNIPAVETHLLAYEDNLLSRQDEARVVTDIIQQTQRQRPKDSLVVLVRSKAHAQTIISSFNDSGITYQANDIDRLDTCMPVLDMLSLTKALLYPQDRIAWLAILRAPWCGLNMHDLHTLVHDRKEGEHWPLLISRILDIAQQDGIIHHLSSAGQKKLQRFARVISTALAQQKRHSLRHWIHGIWLALGGPGLLINIHDKENVNTFLALLDHYEQGGTITRWQDLEQAVNELYAKPTISDKENSVPPVQIMTIHKSKGLEFDTVIIPSLDKRSRSSNKELLLWLERIDYSEQTHQQQRQLLISPINATGDNKDPIYHFIQQQHTEKDQLESDRLLYVGCTRAIKQLHLVAYAGIDHRTYEGSGPLTLKHLKEPSSQTLLQRLWSAIGQNDQQNLLHIIEPNKQKDSQAMSKKTTKLSHPSHIASLPPNWEAPVIQKNELLKPYRGTNQLATVNHRNNTTRKNVATPDALMQREQRYIGTVIHLALQHITETGYKNWNRTRIQKQQCLWKIQLAQKGINPRRLDQAVDIVHQAIDKTLNDKTGQWLLDNTHEDSATELQLWDSKGQHIIDRTFIDTKVIKGMKERIRWVVDYKNSQPSENQTQEAFINEQKQQHQKQLQYYTTLFNHERIPTCSALYFPLNHLWVEI
ncbi:hypothetical protein AB835_09175 [Candidatus Endobugula sertula]|uniref:DNA 3'-5' helicase n=1 Tax=Candidatus Endobugula sertula TaxID=62101 RepID=A0A1D2QP91_9GAMM|nr:hypothetical protein AB835_09175 [Candidatus Endobugula sertula]